MKNSKEEHSDKYYIEKEALAVLCIFFIQIYYFCNSLNCTNCCRRMMSLHSSKKNQENTRTFVEFFCLFQKIHRYTDYYMTSR